MEGGGIRAKMEEGERSGKQGETAEDFDHIFSSLEELDQVRVGWWSGALWLFGVRFGGVWSAGGWLGQKGERLG